MEVLAFSQGYILGITADIISGNEAKLENGYWEKGVHTKCWGIGFPHLINVGEEGFHTCRVPYLVNMGK